MAAEQGLVATSSSQGFTTKGLRGRTAQLWMVPELGGRVVSLRSLRTGREWCWRRPGPHWLWANDAGDDFGSSPQAGIDECVPTVAACQVRGRRLPDHGEVWYQDWRLDPAAEAAGVLRAELNLTVSPFVFTRAIRVDPAGDFVFDYSLRNTGDEPEPWLWCLHPLLALEPGDRLDLPAEVRSLRVNGGLGAPMAMGDRWDYPEPFAGVRLDRCEVPGMPGGCLKAFAGPLGEGRAAVRNDRTGDSLAFRWDSAAIPFLGLWINRGHCGFHHVALEPASGAPDALSGAPGSWDPCPILPPRASVSWSITCLIT